jgi:hypothetical protein
MTELPWFSRGNYYYDTLKKKYFYLSEQESLPANVYTFSPVASGSESDWVRMDVNALDLETDKEYLFYQYFVGVLKKGYVYVQYPVGEQIYTTDKLVPTATRRDVCYIDEMLSPFLNPQPISEFFIVKGVTIAFKYYNNQGDTLVQKLRFVGRKFRHEEVAVGMEHKGKTLTEADMEKIKELARPITMRRVM